MPTPKPWHHYGINMILPEDTDEILLLLLAKDCEPITKHNKPYRRWIFPPINHDIDHKNYPYYRKWTPVAYDWWIREGDSYGKQ